MRLRLPGAGYDYAHVEWIALTEEVPALSLGGHTIVMLGRTRSGQWSVEESARRLSNLHASLLCSVHCLGAWIAIVPTLETKLAYAYHLYEHAVIADQLAQRIYTLTAERPPVPSPANPELPKFLHELAALNTPEEQVAGLYRVLLPTLLQAMREQMERTNPVADEPTVRLLYQASETLEAQIIWSKSEPADPGTVTRLHQELAFAGGLHGTPSVEPAAPHSVGETTHQQLDEDSLKPSLLGVQVSPLLVDPPARDERFQPLQPGQRMPKAKPLETPEGKIRLLHIALINLEIPAIEVCGRMIAEFPEAPWEMKLELAHQIWDEARHAILCADRLLELGGTLGQFPYHHKVWEHSIAGESLAERFLTTQRIHEGNGLDQTLMARDALAAIGDHETSQIMDYIMADEVLHVRSGTRWLNHLLPDPADREALLRKVEERLGVAAVLGPPLNREGRLKAGFTEVELDWLTSLRERRGSSPKGGGGRS